MEKKQRGFTFYAGIVLLLTLGVMVFMTCRSLLQGEPATTSDLISIVLLLVATIELFTWKLDTKAQRDEMGQHIISVSTKLSYYILIVALFLIWIIDRLVFVRKDDLGNLSLFIALCFALIIQPIVEFFIAKRYRSE